MDGANHSFSACLNNGFMPGNFIFYFACETSFLLACNILSRKELSFISF